MKMKIQNNMIIICSRTTSEAKPLGFPSTEKKSDRETHKDANFLSFMHGLTDLNTDEDVISNINRLR